MKLKVYLDTSVFSACFDDRAPDRKSLTEDFWRSHDVYRCSTSYLAVQELRKTNDLQLRSKMESLLVGLELIEMTNEMANLAQKYVAAGAFSHAMENDALHVAAATLTGQDVLLSWNFRHLVNRRRRAVVAEVNTLAQLPVIEILSPPEL